MDKFCFFIGLKKQNNHYQWFNQFIILKNIINLIFKL